MVTYSCWHRLLCASGLLYMAAVAMATTTTGGMAMGNHSHTENSTMGMGGMNHHMNHSASMDNHTDMGVTPHMGHGSHNHMGTTDMNMGGHGDHGGHGGHENTSDACAKCCQMCEGSGHGGHQQQGHGSSSGHGVYFFLRDVHEHLLFREWTIKDWKEMVYSCIGIGVVAALYEGLKVFREYLSRKSKNAGYNVYADKPSRRRGQRCCLHLVQVLLHMIQVFISYSLMLVFMTFNTWLCIAVVAGAGVGYLMFGWARDDVGDQNEHCN